MYIQNTWLFLVLLTFCHTNGDVAAQGVELGAHMTKLIHQTKPRSFPRMGWSALKFDNLIPEASASPTLPCHGEGFYSHPFDCTKFYRCINEFGNNDYSALSFNCAAGTIFSQELGSCISGTCSPDGVAASVVPTDGVAASGVPTDGVAASGVPTDYKAVLELNSPLKSYGSPACLSEGRIADPDDCGQFYDCVRGLNGDFIASKHSCFGHVFDATLKECVPVGKAQGCIPDPINGLRSVNDEDPKLLNLCVDNANKFFCLDCKTLVLCLDRLPQIIPCKYGDTCYNDTNIFRGGVCYPDTPVKCTCNNEDIFRPDIYDPSKFLSCGSQGDEPAIQSCPEGLVFNEVYSSCGAPINTTCSETGKFTVQSDCTKYHTCTYTTSGSFFNSVFTCNNNTMYNEEIGKCEDPCDWYNGTFICKEEGRFPNPEDCTTFFECIKVPLETDKFIKIEHECQRGYEWLPLVDKYHCVAKGTTKEICVPKKTNTCNVPREWCESTTATTTATTTTTTTSTTTTTTTTTPPPPTAEDMCASAGGELFNGKCLSFTNGYTHTWAQAKDACAAVEGRRLASFDDTNAAYDYIITNHHSQWYWTGGTDAAIEGTWRWLDGRTFVPNPLNIGYDVSPGNTHDCLMVLGARSLSGGYQANKCSVQCGYICELDMCVIAGGELVNGKCLSFTDGDTHTWAQARDACAVLVGGRLASFDDTNAALDYITTTRSHAQYYWIGGSDAANEGTWMWLDGRTFVPNPWQSSGPMVTPGNTYDCLQVLGGDGYYDYECNDTVGYICELDL